MEIAKTVVDSMTSEAMRKKVVNLQKEIIKLPQYQPITNHTFFAGMYCREVYRDAGVCIVGRVHKKEHFYYIVFGTVTITTDNGVQTITGPHLLCSRPGTKRAVFAETNALCMTIHKTDAQTPDEAENELVEYDEDCMYTSENIIKANLIEGVL